MRVFRVCTTEASHGLYGAPVIHTRTRDISALCTSTRSSVSTPHTATGFLTSSTCFLPFLPLRQLRAKVAIAEAPPMTQPTALETMGDFRTFAATTTQPKLLLCYQASNGDPLADGESVVCRTQRAVVNVLTERATTFPVSLATWNCFRFTDAKQLLGIQDSTEVTLFVLYKGAVVDAIHGSESIQGTFPTLLRNMEQLVNAQVASTSSSGGAAVNVAKLMATGKDLLSKAQPVYAEKFFHKAVGVLEIVVAESPLAEGDGPHAQSAERESVLQALAGALSWELMAQLVQGPTRTTDATETHAKLAAPLLEHFTREPLSDAARAVASRDLIRFAPATWSGETCSVQHLQQAFVQQPADAATRSRLVITYFFRGDMERCLTEALKLHVLGADFGATSIDIVSRFLGADHELVRSLGVHQGTGVREAAVTR